MEINQRHSIHLSTHFLYMDELLCQILGPLPPPPSSPPLHLRHMACCLPTITTGTTILTKKNDPLQKYSGHKCEYYGEKNLLFFIPENRNIYVMPSWICNGNRECVMHIACAMLCSVSHYITHTCTVKSVTNVGVCIFLTHKLRHTENKCFMIGIYLCFSLSSGKQKECGEKSVSQNVAPGKKGAASNGKIEVWVCCAMFEQCHAQCIYVFPDELFGR